MKKLLEEIGDAISSVLISRAKRGDIDGMATAVFAIHSIAAELGSRHGIAPRMAAAIHLVSVSDSERQAMDELRAICHRTSAAETDIGASVLRNMGKGV